MSTLFGLFLIVYLWLGEPSRTTSVPAPLPSSNIRPDNVYHEVERLTEKIRSAHLHKDINKFMSCYHPAYPELGRLEALTLENWKNYDFKNISYHISDIKVLGPDQIRAEVVWNFQLYNNQTKAYELHRAAFQVVLEKSRDGWKIRESKEIGYS